MQIRFSKKGTTLIVSIIGELDHHTAGDVRQKVDAKIVESTTRDVIFDLEHLEFMDSSGIGVIMGRYKNIRKLGGRVFIAGENQQVNRIFEMSGVDKIIPIYKDKETVLNNLKRERK